MSNHPLAGKPAPETLLANIPQLVSRYYRQTPDPERPEQQVTFGTSGHRGSALKNSFNEHHVLAISQALADYRLANRIDGPLFMGIDTHALSEPALISAVEVLAANGVELRLQPNGGYTPTPAVSFAIIEHNRNKSKKLADGVVITPSHNPPEDGGFKYNSPNGGPADGNVTKAIEIAANNYLKAGLKGVKRISYQQALAAETTQQHDFMAPYIDALEQAVDMPLIASSGLRIGVDPMGGAGVGYWQPIAERWKLDLEVVNPGVDPTFRFVRVDKDGKIRMDCSSSSAMAGLIGLKDRFDIAFGNDADADRHGIVTPSGGLMNSNHYLSVAIDYLFRNRPDWPAQAAIGKTLVSSSMIDRIAKQLGRPLSEVPVGFKWFVEGLSDGSYGFGGEESAGATFLRKNGSVWTTDKDGLLLNLLAAEITAKTGADTSAYYQQLEQQHGSPLTERIDAPASWEQKARLANLSADVITTKTLAGEPILSCLTEAPGNNAAIGGLKVTTENGWFAARPSGTEDIYKIYTESFKGKGHLKEIQEQAKEIVNGVLIF